MVMGGDGKGKVGGKRLNYGSYFEVWSVGASGDEVGR